MILVMVKIVISQSFMYKCKTPMAMAGMETFLLSAMRFLVWKQGLEIL